MRSMPAGNAPKVLRRTNLSAESILVVEFAPPPSHSSGEHAEPPCIAAALLAGQISANNTRIESASVTRLPYCNADESSQPYAMPM